MARTAVCKTCGRRIRPSGPDIKLGSAVRKHYWRVHREVMMRTRPEQQWDADRSRGRRRGARG